MEEKNQTSSPEQIKKMFRSPKGYQDHSQFFQKRVKEEHFETIINISLIMREYLPFHNYNPYSKLLMLRFLKQCVVSPNYTFLTLLNALLADILFKYAIFDRKSRNSKRGMELFLNYSGKQHSQDDLKTIGWSFHLLVIEIFQKIGKWMKLPPCHVEPCVNSSIARRYENLVQSKVQLSQDFVYFKEKDRRQFFKNMLTKDNKSINIFYDYLFERLKKGQESQTMKIIKNIIQSGDMYCIHRMIENLKNQILEDEKGKEQNFNYMRIIHQLFLIGEIETIYLIEKELLLLILEKYKKKYQPYYHSFQITSWWYLLINAEGFSSEFSNAFKRVSTTLKGCQASDLFEIKKKFLSQCQFLKQNNLKKIQYLNFFYPSKEQILNAIGPIRSKSTSKSLVLQLESEKFPDYLLAPKQKRRRSLNKTLKSKESRDFSRQSHFSFSVQKKQQQKEKQRTKVSEYQKKIFQSSINKEYQARKKLKIINKSQNHQNQKSYIHGRNRSAPCENPERNLHDIENLKLKAKVLQKKVLIFKNSDIEIGLITKLSENICKAQIYATPLNDLHNLRIQINTPKWLTLSSEKDYIKKKAYILQQDVISCHFTRSSFQDSLSLPQLVVQYEKDTSLTQKKVFMPIMLTKFCEQTTVDKQKLDLLIRNSSQIQQIKKEKKIFAKFTEYFQKAIQIENCSYAIAFIFEEKEYYLIVASIERQKAQLLMINEGNNSGNQLLKAFAFILGR